MDYPRRLKTLHGSSCGSALELLGYLAPTNIAMLDDKEAIFCKHFEQLNTIAVLKDRLEKLEEEAKKIQL